MQQLPTPDTVASQVSPGASTRRGTSGPVVDADLAVRHPRRRRALLVVDGFYRDPMALRAHALGLTYREHGRGKDGYTGLIANLPGELALAPVAAIAEHLDVALECTAATQGAIRCITTEHYAEKVDAYPEAARHLGWLHYDGFDWTALISLCPDAIARGHTSFWRHTGFGLDGFHDPVRVHQVLREHGLTLDELIARVDADFVDPSCWQEVGRVTHAFNRLIAFRGESFHVSSEGFGTSPHDSKMTQNFFLDEVRDPSVPAPHGRVRFGTEHR